MRRAALVIAAFLLLPVAARAASRCQRPAEQPEALWFTEHGYPRYGDRFTCGADAAGAYTVTVTAISGKERSPVGEPKKREVPLRRQPHDHFVLEEISRSVCQERKPPPGAKVSLTGPPGDEVMTFEVGVEARFEGSGDLADLRRTVTGTFPCRACDPHGGSLYFRILDWKKTAELEISMDPEWYACFKRGATLQVRLFYGEEQKLALGAIRPDLVIPLPLAQVEAAASNKDGKLVGKLAVPYAKLCKGKPQSSPKWIAWELWGDGILFKGGGGGRSVDSGICK